MQAGPNISFLCEGVIEPLNGAAPTPPLKIRLLNPAIAGLASGVMPCEVQLLGRKNLKGNVRKTEVENVFVLENLN